MRLLLRLALLAALCLPNSAALANLELMAHELRPFFWLDQGAQPRGFAYELVQLIQRELGEVLPVETVPFNRGLSLVQTTASRALFICARSTEREKTLKWVGPLLKSAVYVYKLKRSPAKIETLQDLQKIRAIGVQLGNRDDAFLTALGLNNVFRSNSQALALRALLSGRVDAIPVGEHTIPGLVVQEGISMDLLERTPLKLYDNDLYIAFSLNVDDATIQRWQRALDKVKREHYPALYKKYLQ